MILQDVATAAPEARYTYGVLAFLLVCIGAWLVRERNRAIRAERLLRAARRYALGDTSGGTGVRGPDELGVLSDALEQMGARLRTLAATLRDRQAWFEMLLEHGSEVILTLDREWRIVFATPSLLPVLGWTPDEVARRPLADFIHPDDAEGMRAALELTVTQPRLGEPIAVRVRHASGGWRTLEAVGSHPKDWSGPEHIIVSARDITTRERLEGQLRQGQKLEALGRFAGGVAQDFNNLLTAIQGYASLLLMDLGPLDPRREDLEEIRKASERATALTRQMLLFSRDDGGEPEPTDLNAVVTDVGRMLPRLIGDDVMLATALDPSLRAVHADPRQVEQVLMNLAVNARDAMPGGGRLTIATANQQITTEDPRVGPDLPPGWYAALSVRDTGAGMTPEVQANIFDPFFTTREPRDGTGLGLSTVYGIVKHAGGHIEVESAPGAGTTVRILLPELDVRPRGHAHRRLEPGPRGDETILLVEDEDAVRVFASTALEREGYTVLEARHGRDALRRLSEHPGPVDLVITDIVMPEMGGNELARRLAAERPDLRVLYMSGYGDGETPLRGLSAGAAYLQKPFTSDVLARKVREVLAVVAPGVTARRDRSG